MEPENAVTISAAKFEASAAQSQLEEEPSQNFCLL